MFVQKRSAFKVDIQKAYDTVNWSFLRRILYYFGFHPHMVQMIMACVTSVTFSISLHGQFHGYFKGERGLRQGDPMSPYLFTLVMEVLTLLIRRRVAASEEFQYHLQCERQKIVNIVLLMIYFCSVRDMCNQFRLSTLPLLNSQTCQD